MSYTVYKHSIYMNRTRINFLYLISTYFIFNNTVKEKSSIKCDETFLVVPQRCGQFGDHRSTFKQEKIPKKIKCKKTSKCLKNIRYHNVNKANNHCHRVKP